MASGTRHKTIDFQKLLAFSDSDESESDQGLSSDEEAELDDDLLGNRSSESEEDDDDHNQVQQGQALQRGAGDQIPQR
mgnify:CR=1 FL=1